MTDYPEALQQAALRSGEHAVQQAERASREPSRYLGIDTPSARIRVFLDAHDSRMHADPDSIVGVCTPVTGGQQIDLSPRDLRSVLAELDKLREEHRQLEDNLRKVLRQRQSAEECIRSARAALESLPVRDGYRRA